ncbi:MAG: hypothetical protein CME61_00795 [Halobacteriovoraceae bacterium]|nr:hypothetical protein [Halobacteriovoraceae bacterium]
MIEAIGYSSDAPETHFFIYQNFILGYLYKLFPDFLDIFGYNWFHIFTQFIFLSSSIYFLKEVKKLSWKLITVILIPLFLYLFFVSQYSITPVLLFFSGLVIIGHKKDKAYVSHALGLFFIVYASMVRIEAFYFSVACFFPFALHFLKSNRQKLFFSSALIISVVLNLIHQEASKKHLATKDFFQKTIERKKILDYRGGDFLLNHSNYLKESGLSINDVKLFKNWFLLDKDINKKILSDQVQKKISPSTLQRVKWGLSSLLFLKGHELFFLSLLFLITLILSFNKYSITSSVVFFMAIFISGFLGREPLIRVYIGPLMALSLLNIYFIKFSNRNTALICIPLLLIFGFNNIRQMSNNKHLLQKGERHLTFLLKEKDARPNLNLYFWSHSSMFANYLYPLKNHPRIRDLSFTRTSYIWSNSKDPHGKERMEKFRNDFTSEHGITLIFDHLNDRYFAPLIKTYCQERFKKNIYTSSVSEPKTNDLHLITFKCL